MKSIFHTVNFNLLYEMKYDPDRHQDALLCDDMLFKFIFRFVIGIQF